MSSEVLLKVSSIVMRRKTNSKPEIKEGKFIQGYDHYVYEMECEWKIRQLFPFPIHSCIYIHI